METKTATILLSLSVTLVLLACSLRTSANPGDGDDEPTKGTAGSVLTEEHGTIEKVSDTWYGIVPDYDHGTRFDPGELPEDLRQDGLRVVFSGVVQEIPPGARMWGAPLELTSCERLEDVPAQPAAPEEPEEP